jgi:hypothetical protein
MYPLLTRSYVSTKALHSSVVSNNYDFFHICKGLKGNNKEWNGKKRYSSTLSLTSALEEGWWSTPSPGSFNPGKRPGTHCTGGRLQKISPTSEFDPQTVQPTTQHHIPEDLTTQQHRCEKLHLENDRLNRLVRKIHLHARPKWNQFPAK